MASAAKMLNDKVFLNQAIELARSGKKAEARHLLQKICLLNPANAKAWLWRASLAETTPQAIGYLEQVLRLQPGDQTALAWLERISPTAPEQRYECPFCTHDSDEDFERCPGCKSVVNLDPRAIEANQGVDERQLRFAIQHYKGLEGAADTFDIQYYLGLAHLNLRDSHAALGYFRRAWEIESGDAGLREAIAALEARRLIMVVDDSPTIRTLVSSTLDRSGYRVVTVANGLDALSLLDKESPEFVLLDVTMPFMDGYQLCKAIKSHPKSKKVTVVMLSGNDGFFDKVKGRMAGASDYLTKPFEPAILLRVIGKYLR